MVLKVLANSGKINGLFDTCSSKDSLIPNTTHLEKPGAEERASGEDHFLIGIDYRYVRQRHASCAVAVGVLHVNFCHRRFRHYCKLRTSEGKVGVCAMGLVVVG